MRSLVFVSLIFSLYTYLSSSIPVYQKRLDLDGNGVPDMCFTDSNGAATCFENSAATSTSNSDATTTAAASVTLPPPAEWNSQNGTTWSIEYVGNLEFTEVLQEKGLGGDKCRSSVLGGKVIWNCGDMLCGMNSSAEEGSWTICGMAMGPAFYGAESLMTIDTDNISLVQTNEFALPWEGDPAPEYPQTNWGMDTSNVAAINDTHGVAYVWEIWRGALDGSIVDRGAGAVSVTLGEDKPIATRVGPLLSGPDAVQLGLFSILSDGGYIYTYTMGGPTGMMVGRVNASDDVFDATKYEFLSVASNYTSWSTPGEIPSSSSEEFGMQTANSDGSFTCNVYGSVYYNAYLKRYVMTCTIYMSYTNMYISETPWGPWSAEYDLLSGWGPGYGSHAHPEYSEDDGKTWYFSQGPNGPFNVFKVTLP